MSNLQQRIQSELELISSSDKNNNYYKFIEEVNNIIDKYPEDSVKVGLDLMIKSYNWKPWSFIDLSKENFDNLGRHKRAWYINDNIYGIYNTLAYTGKVRKFYIKDENDIRQVPVGVIIDNDEEIIDERIYISRGGIINGDYIHKCYLKNQTDFYNIKDPIKLPVSSIEEKNGVDFILFIDHREPKLKALMEFYNVSIEHDDNIKFNVRTFNKLK